MNSYQRQLQSLSSQLLIVEERQRRCFARVLHDRIGQNLTSSKIKLAMLSSQLEHSNSQVVATLQDIIQLIEEMSRETRSLTYELSPPLLYEIGLDAALEWLCEHFQTRHGLACAYAASNQPETIVIDARIVLFQSARELLFNVVKHAGAKNAGISYVRSRERACITIYDDGAGFESVRSTTSTGGFGLFNVRERMQFIGGHMEIDSAPSKGARVSLVLTQRALDEGFAAAETTPA